MSIETSYGFLTAQAAYENATPYDGECACEESGWWTCDDCGHTQDAGGICPEPEHAPPAELRTMTREEIAESYPSQRCPEHGWCGGCSSRYCEECAP